MRPICSPLRRLQCSRKVHSTSTDPFNAFLSHSRPPPSPSDAIDDSLHGRSIALKDNICTNDGLPTACASQMLEGASPTSIVMT
jgi:Asp-tRNA(Asn)/Glu-tRNA(Gln) amidotransferase A subunit family amidase